MNSVFLCVSVVNHVGKGAPQRHREHRGSTEKDGLVTIRSLFRQTPEQATDVLTPHPSAAGVLPHKDPIQEVLHQSQTRCISHVGFTPRGGLQASAELLKLSRSWSYYSPPTSWRAPRAQRLQLITATWETTAGRATRTSMPLSPFAPPAPIRTSRGRRQPAA